MAVVGYSVPTSLTDDAGNAMESITVTVTGPNAYSGSAVTSGQGGILQLGPLPPGDYTVTYGSRSVTVPVLVGIPSGGTAGQVLRIAAGGTSLEWAAPAAGGGASDAASVTVTPTGALSSTNVQAALAELDGEKQPLDADLTTLAAMDNTVAGVVASDGAGLIKKTYTALKTALSLTKSDVGLGNVDNTSDANKPISTATAAALAGKQASGTYAPLVADWTASTVYTVGQLVSNSGSIYRVSTAHTSTGSFDATKFTSLGGSQAASVTTVAASGSTRTLTLPTGGVPAAFDVTLTANCTLTLAGAVAGVESTWDIYLRQDGTGSRTVTWPGALTWADGAAAPVLSTTPGAVDVITVTSLDGGTTFLAVGGRAASSSSGGLLAVKQYALPSAVTTTSSSASDVDATNLAVTFTAPASGKVIVRLTGLLQGASSTTYDWLIREGSTTLVDVSVNFGGPSGVSVNASAAMYVTGLTPGSSHTYKWAHRDSFGSGSAGISAGSYCVMEVEAA